MFIIHFRVGFCNGSGRENFIRRGTFTGESVTRCGNVHRENFTRRGNMQNAFTEFFLFFDKIFHFPANFFLPQIDNPAPDLL